MDYGAIVVGAGHNGLICAAYLARAGIPTLLVEARAEVGGCASTVDALGARVNICNCDHVVFRTTPVIDELDLASHGLALPRRRTAQVQARGTVRRRGRCSTTSSAPSTRSSSSIPTKSTATGATPTLRSRSPSSSSRWRACRPRREACCKRLAAPPRARRRDAAALEPAHRRRRAALVLLARGDHGARGDDWSRGGGPLTVRAPHRPGCAHLRDEARRPDGRPVGGSGAVPASILAAFAAAGGTLRTNARVAGILCEGDHVRGVELADGEVIEAPLVVSACDPRETFVRVAERSASGGPPADRARGARRRCRTATSRRSTRSSRRSRASDRSTEAVRAARVDEPADRHHDRVADAQ